MKIDLNSKSILEYLDKEEEISNFSGISFHKWNSEKTERFFLFPIQLITLESKNTKYKNQKGLIAITIYSDSENNEFEIKKECLTLFASLNTQYLSSLEKLIEAKRKPKRSLLFLKYLGKHKYKGFHVHSAILKPVSERLSDEIEAKIPIEKFLRELKVEIPKFQERFSPKQEIKEKNVLEMLQKSLEKEKAEKKEKTE